MKKRFKITIGIFAGIAILLAVGLIVLREQYLPPYPTPPREKLYEEKLAMRDWTPSQTISGAELPQAVDNSVSPYFPAVFSQTGNSCAQAAGIRYMFTYEMNRLLGRSAGGDGNTFSYRWTWNFLNGGENNGTWAEYGLSLVRDAGAMSVSDFPPQTVTGAYKWATGYDKYFNALHYRVKDILSFNCTSADDIENIKHYLYDKGEGVDCGGVLLIYTYYYDWKLDAAYSGPSATGYKSIMTKPATKGAHALTISGYDDTVESRDVDGNISRGAFIAVNTWGAGAAGHDRGRFYIPYHFLTAERKSKSFGYQAIGIVPEYKSPEVVFKLRLQSASRNDLHITMGVSDDPYAGRPDIYKTSPIVWGQGGNIPMQGKDNPPDIELALDFSDQIDRYAHYSDIKYFVNIINDCEDAQDCEAFIEYFSVVDYRGDKDNPTEYICEEITGKTPLRSGSNRFSIYISPPRTTSASPYRWKSDIVRSGDEITTPFVIRTADGKYAKIQFKTHIPDSPEVEIEYVYQPSGSTHIK